MYLPKWSKPCKKLKLESRQNIARCHSLLANWRYMHILFMWLRDDIRVLILALVGTWKLGHIAKVGFVKHVTLNSQNHTVNFQIIASNRNLPIGYTGIYYLHVLCMQSNMLQQLFYFKPGKVLENPNLFFQYTIILKKINIYKYPYLYNNKIITS